MTPTICPIHLAENSSALLRICWRLLLCIAFTLLARYWYSSIALQSKPARLPHRPILKPGGTCPSPHSVFSLGPTPPLPRAPVAMVGMAGTQAPRSREGEEMAGRYRSGQTGLRPTSSRLRETGVLRRYFQWLLPASSGLLVVLRAFPGAHHNPAPKTQIYLGWMGHIMCVVKIVEWPPLYFSSLVARDY